MRKLVTLLSIIALSFVLITPAMAFLDNNSTSNAGASADAAADSSSGGNSLTNTGNHVYEPGKRYFGPADEANYPGAPNMFGGANPSYMDRLEIKNIDEDGLILNKALQMRRGDTSMGKRIMVRAVHVLAPKNLKFTVTGKNAAELKVLLKN